MIVRTVLEHENNDVLNGKTVVGIHDSILRALGRYY